MSKLKKFALFLAALALAGAAGWAAGWLFSRFVGWAII